MRAQNSVSLLFTAWCSHVGAAGVAWPAWGWAGSRVAARQAGSGPSGSRSSQGSQSPGRCHRGQTQGWAWAAGLAWPGATAKAPAQPGVSEQDPLSHLSWVLSGWTWAGADTEQGAPRWVSGKRLQSLLVHLGPGGVSSSHAFFQLFFTVTIHGIRFIFFLCIFFILDFSTSGFQWRGKKILVGHEQKAGSTWQFSCYFQHIWLLHSGAPLCQTILVILFSQDKQSPWFSTMNCILNWELNQGARAL